MKRLPSRHDQRPSKPRPVQSVVVSARLIPQSEPALLDLLGREGLSWHRQMRREQIHGMLLEVS